MPDPDSRLLKKVNSIGIVGRAESPNADDAVRDHLFDHGGDHYGQAVSAVLAGAGG